MARLSSRQRRALGNRFRALQELRYARLRTRLRVFFREQADRAVRRYLSAPARAQLVEVHSAWRVRSAVGVIEGPRGLEYKEEGDDESDDEYDEGDAELEAGEILPPDENRLLGTVIRPDLLDQYEQSSQLASQLSGHVPPTEIDQRVLDYLGEAGNRVVDINDTTRDAIRDVLQTGHEFGLSPWQMAHGIDNPSELQIAQGIPRDGLPGIEDVVEATYANRADTIARTELAEASNAAAVDRYDDAGVQELEIEDGGTPTSCAACDERDGDIYPIDEPPHLLHPNCTMTLLPVLT